MRYTARWPQHGLTLTELLVTLALASVLLAAGAPSLVEVVHASSLATASGELMAHLYLARAEALKRNRRVTLCKSLDGAQCSTKGGWEQGWIVFHDENGSGLLDEGEEVLARHGSLQRNLRLVGNQSVAAYISYTGLGTSRLAGGGFQAGTLTLCRRSGAPTPARQVVLNAIGRPRVERATVPNCQ